MAGAALYRPRSGINSWTRGLTAQCRRQESSLPVLAVPLWGGQVTWLAQLGTPAVGCAIAPIWGPVGVRLLHRPGCVGLRPNLSVPGVAGARPDLRPQMGARWARDPASGLAKNGDIGARQGSATAQVPVGIRSVIEFGGPKAFWSLSASEPRPASRQFFTACRPVLKRLGRPVP